MIRYVSNNVPSKTIIVFAQIFFYNKILDTSETLIIALSYTHYSISNYMFGRCIWCINNKSKLVNLNWKPRNIRPVKIYLVYTYMEGFCRTVNTFVIHAICGFGISSFTFNYLNRESQLVAGLTWKGFMRYFVQIIVFISKN